MARNKRRLHENQPATEPANEPATEHQQPSGRKTRGPTRCLSLISLPNGKKLKIDHSIKTQQPIGKNVSKLTNFLGTLARNGTQLPLTYEDLRYMPAENKNEVWQIIQSKFEIDPCLRWWVEMSLGKKWKDFKSDLKSKHYYTHETRAERIADLDSRVEQAQWEALVDFWDSEKGKKRSERNKVNRSKQKICHTTGSKSFAQVWDEEEKKRTDGRDPTRSEIFIITHRPKDGKATPQPIENIISQLTEQATQLPEGEHDSVAKDDVFAKVIGEDRHGCVRTFGMGASPSSLWGPTTSRDEELREAKESARAANEELGEVKKEMSNVKAEVSTLKAQIAMILSSMQLRSPNVVGEPSEPLREVTEDIASTQTSPNPRVRSSSSSHPATSHERRPTKRGKGQ